MVALGSLKSRKSGDAVPLEDRVAIAAFSLCLAIVGSEEVAVAIVSEACLAAPVGSRPPEQAAWLLGEVHRKAVTAVREREVEQRSVDANDVARLLRGFEGLNDEQRLAIGLVYFGGLTVNRAASRLEISTERMLGLLDSGLRRIGASDVRRNG